MRRKTAPDFIIKWLPKHENNKKRKFLYARQITEGRYTDITFAARPLAKYMSTTSKPLANRLGD